MCGEGVFNHNVYSFIHYLAEVVVFRGQKNLATKLGTLKIQ